MKKKVLSALLSVSMLSTLLAGCGASQAGDSATASSQAAASAASSAPAATAAATSAAAATSTASASGDYDLTLYTIQSTDTDFSDWLSRAEAGTGLKINVIAAPTDSDTRQQKITTVLSTGDTSVDIIEINDEMATSFKNTGWLAPLSDTVMTQDVVSNMSASGYITDMLTNTSGQIIGVPTYQGYLALWVNQKIMDEVGIKEINTKEDLMNYIKKASGNGRYGYGGSWEKTYVFNEIAEFVYLFGGDYFDWTKQGNRDALQFMHDMVTNGETPIDQIADKYEQMNQKFNDGKYGCVFMWGTGSDYKAADMLGDDKIHQINIPVFSGDKASIFTDSWSYVENAATTHKDACEKFLKWACSDDGYKAGWDDFDRYPATKTGVAAAVPDDNWVKTAYTEYAEKDNVHGRPMLPQTMEYITDIGTIFQDYVQDKISLDDFCTKAQEYVKECQ
jgi:multiple sugar transport system substrate-binding protein